MDEEPIEPEVVGSGPRRFTFRSVGSPWALFGLMGALGALGALGVAAVLALSVGWFFLVALAYRWLWNYAFSADVTQLVYGAQSLGYPKALASVALFLLAGWLMSPKRGT